MKNKRRGAGWVVAVVLLLVVTIMACTYLTIHKFQNKTESISQTSVEDIIIKVGDDSISEYVIAYDMGCKGAALRLQSLIYDATGVKLKTTLVNKGKSIHLSLNKNSQEINIVDGNIEIIANNADQLIGQVNVFANSYLGYAFAGDSREHILENTDIINIPANYSNAVNPWIEEREPIICLWKTNAVRGIYPDANVSLKSELMSYSDDELYNYVKMMKYCGYTGIQVTDMCSTWAQYGGYEFVQQRIRYMADAAHSLDMKFTLWVWGAEFEGYGWVDDSVVYNSPEYLPRDNPDTNAVFDKYYSIYAKLADCSDRVIMHFNDPGKLSDSADIAYYAAMFQKKCLEVNPDISFGVSCYTYQIMLEELVKYMDEPFMVYSGTAKEIGDLETVGRFREYAINNNLEMGVWSWNLTEMEIDQLAEMNVNAKVIANTYKLNKELDDIYQVKYWSEMDSYHVINIFSMYCAGRMLQNPELDPDETLKNVCTEVVGEEYSEDLYEVLSIIQDARSGETFSEFKNGYSDYLLTSDKYDAKGILDRCNEAIPKLDAMAEMELNENTIPLPISTKELLMMIRPHLQEIKEFAEFRIMLDVANDKLANGVDKEDIYKYVETNYRPVAEYNTVVGSWGCAEGYAQYDMLEKFCQKAGIDTPHDPVFDYYRKERIYGEMVTFQKTENTCYKFSKGTAFQYGLAFSEEDTIRLVDEMLEDGILKQDSDGKVYLTNWENYRYDF